MRRALGRSRPHADYLHEHLADDDGAAALLAEAFSTGDEGDIMYALRAIAEARGGVARIAARSGLSRETLYRTLSRAGNPRLTSLRAILEASGLRLTVEPAKAATQARKTNRAPRDREAARAKQREAA